MDNRCEIISSSTCFGGQQQRVKHYSTVNNCDMHFQIYLPPTATDGKRVPCIFWLSGLTCTDENFVFKSGAQKYAAEHGVALIAPDTSPRGEDVPDGDPGEWDFGKGAGFYVDATEAPWNKNYNMYSYISQELPNIIADQFPVQIDNAAIMGHSMGGHGALVIAFRNPDRFKSVSAFSPICAPSQCPWGKKAFSNYLGSNREKWEQYDASALIKSTSYRASILIDQGESDEFLKNQLMPDILREASNEVRLPLIFRMQKGYDHSYYFIASFIGEHIGYHAKAICQ